MNILAIDPGYEQTGWVIFDGRRVTAHNIEPNPLVLAQLTTLDYEVVVIEHIESYGMAVGREVFRTVHWAGRFFQRAADPNLVHRRHPITAYEMTRKTVKLHLCNTIRATDANVRQALWDRFGVEKAIAVGTKAAQGPLYGIKAHEYAALGLAITWCDQQMPVKTQARA